MRRSQTERKRDPDVVALVEAGGGLSDARSLVLTQARKLNASYRRFESTGNTPMERLKFIASLQGLTLAPMNVERSRNEGRDAVVMLSGAEKGKRGQILYNPDRPAGRQAFSVAHEIAHTFFPSTSGGARFREMTASDSQEMSELERLCDLGAAEVLMPREEFQASAGGNWSIESIEHLIGEFGSSREATVFRLASAYPGIAAAGLLCFRRTKGDQAKLKSMMQYPQANLFGSAVSAQSMSGIADPKYRRQSFHTSDNFPASHTVRWNKSFDENSIVYRVGPFGAMSSREPLPNDMGGEGTLEVIQAPYQREDADMEHPDILFYWRAA
jgi:Zn-dependent peptidase ImmA (M78 family)